MIEIIFIITIDSEKYSISDGLSKSLVIWNQPAMIVVRTLPKNDTRVVIDNTTPLGQTQVRR